MDLINLPKTKKVRKKRELQKDPVTGEIDHFTKTPEARALFNAHKKHANNIFGKNQYSVTNSFIPYPLKYAIADALLKDNKSVDYISTYTGLSHETVYRIKRGEIKLLRSVVDEAKKYEENNLVILGNAILDRVSQEDVENASLLQKTTAYCQLFDKRRLLNNQSTGNVSIVQQLAEISKETSKAEIMLSKLKSIGDK